MIRLQKRLPVLASLCTALLLASCASDGGSATPGSLREDPLRSDRLDEQRVARLNAAQMYQSAREAMNSSDYTTALQLYDRLDALFPFTEYATQGKLESIYAHYRAFSPELALSAADRFLRAHPRHEHLDYVLYLRGLVNFDRGATDILDALNIDATSRDPINARRAFDDFGRLVRRFPDSRYAPDARQRMVYLRERIARHEISIARFYESRRAWVATSRRALDIVSKYQGTAVMPEALSLLEKSYTELGLNDRAEQIRQIRDASFGDDMVLPEAPKPIDPSQIAEPPASEDLESSEA